MLLYNVQEVKKYRNGKKIKIKQCKTNKKLLKPILLDTPGFVLKQLKYLQNCFVLYSDTSYSTRKLKDITITPTAMERRKIKRRFPQLQWGEGK